MARLLFLVLMVLGVYLVVRALRGPEKPRDPGRIDAKTLQQCAHCGTFVPEQQAVHSGDKTFCSTGHRDDYAGASRD